MSSRHIRRTVVTATAPLLALAGAAWVSAAPVPFGESEYDLVLDDQLSWSAAETAAGAAGGRLATIASAEEQAFIEGLLADRNAPTGAYFFGLQETAAPSVFAPTNGETSAFSNFAPGEPNNGTGVVDETVGSVYWTSDTDSGIVTFARRGEWNDVPEGGYPDPVAGSPPFPDLLRAGYLVEFDDVGNGGGGGNGGEPQPIPIPPAALAFPGAAALAYLAARGMRRTA